MRDHYYSSEQTAFILKLAIVAKWIADLLKIWVMKISTYVTLHLSNHNHRWLEMLEDLFDFWEIEASQLDNWVSLWAVSSLLV